MRLFAIVILLLALLSCQNLNKNRKNRISKNWSHVKSWSFSGKMAINDGINNGSGKINWKVENGYLTAQFKAPLGQGSWKIQENQHAAQLISTKLPDKFAANAQILITAEIGWNFPLEQLKFWLRGFYYKEKLQLHQSTIESISDLGWKISFQKWQSTPMGLLPIKIKASKPPYAVKLVIYQWNFN